MNETSKKMIGMIGLVLLIAIMFIAPSKQLKAAENENNDTVDAWNQTEYAADINMEYKGSWQCAAYAKFAFYARYNHSCGLADPNNIVSKYTVTSGNELEQIIKEYAVPGDAIRVSLYENGVESTTVTHIFILESYDNGICVSESNYGVANRARIHTYSDGTDILKQCCRKDRGVFLVKIIHSEFNSPEESTGKLQLEVLPVSNISSHSAQINFNVVNSGNIPIDKVGCMLRFKHTKIWFPLVGEDNLYATPYAGLVYYPISKDGEIAIDLLADTSYVFKCYIVTADGITLYSNEYEFKTKETPISNFTVEPSLFNQVRVKFVTTHSTKKAFTQAGLYITNEQNETFRYIEHVDEKYWYWSSVSTSYQIGHLAEVDYNLVKGQEYEITPYVVIGGIEHRGNSVCWKFE